MKFLCGKGSLVSDTTTDSAAERCWCESPAQGHILMHCTHTHSLHTQPLLFVQEQWGGKHSGRGLKPAHCVFTGFAPHRPPHCRLGLSSARPRTLFHDTLLVAPCQQATRWPSWSRLPGARSVRLRSSSGRERWGRAERLAPSSQAFPDVTRTEPC